MIGRTVSHYQIVERLGAGGMGEVYKARDTLLERFVAVKALPTGLSDQSERRQRFLREARTASALNHRGIITIHNVVTSDGADYIIMELVDGEPLDRVVPEQGLPTARALDYALQTADALAAAHRAGVIHRDLKPGNVMVNRDGEIKVLDFGLAKYDEAPRDSLAPTEVEEAPLTQTGMLLGTLDFMSPEQAMGEAVDARSDVFSFGILLYVMLTGERPFQGKNTASRIHAIVYDEPRKLSEIRPGVPMHLETIVERALEKQRGDRWQSMSELADALRGIGPAADGSDESTLLAERPPTKAAPREPLRRFFRDHARVVAGAVILVAALTAAFVPSVRRGLTELVPTAAETDGESLAPHAILERGFSALARYDREGNIDRAIADFQRILEDDEDNSAALAGLARAYWLDGVHGSKDPVRVEQALAVADRAVAADELLVVALASRGLVYEELGRLEEARADFERALVLEPSDDASIYGLGRIQEAEGDLGQAEASYRRAIEARPQAWEYYAQLGTLFHRQGRYEEAETAFRGGVEAVPDSAANHRNLGAAHYMQGELAEAASAFQKALEIEPEAWLYSNLGTLLFAQGLYPQAVSAFEKAIEQGGANSYPVWANLADAYRWTPDNDEAARDAYLRALQLLEEKLDSDPDDVTLSSRKALYLAKRGDRERAVEEIARTERLAGLDAVARYRLAVANEVAGRREAALEALELALVEGYSPSDVKSDPELLELRQDPRYHRRIVRILAPTES